MTNLPASPLDAILQQAAALPAESGTAARYAARLAGTTDMVVVLLDVSGSMAEPAGALRKIDVLRAALDTALTGRETLIAFSSVVHLIPSPAALPVPAGGTALHLALAYASTFHPRLTLVTSDGKPDDEQAALAAAAALPGRIDVIYCGPDDDYAAIGFMRRLAAVGAGRAHVHDIRHHAPRAALPAAIRGLLPGGAS